MRATSIRFNERTLAEAQEAARKRDMTFTGYVTGLIVADIYGTEAGVEEEPEQGAEVGADEQWRADMQASFDEVERRLSRLEELAEGQGY